MIKSNHPSPVNPNELAAVITVIARRNRTAHPQGRFDNAKRWYPSELLECCRGIREPSRALPFSLMTHCRTIEHIAREYHCDPVRLKRLVRAANGAETRTDILRNLANNGYEIPAEELAKLL